MGNEQVQVKTFPAAEELPEEQRAEIRELFERVYFQYFDSAGVGAPGRTRFLALRDDRVIGFAAYATKGRYAYIMNLAVDREERGSGAAIALEQTRRAHLRKAGLHGYGTCTCDDLTSQRFKIALGYRPVHVRYGWHENMRAPGRHTSVLTVVEGPTPITPDVVPAMHADPANNAVRYLANDLRQLTGLPDDNTYVDVLTSAELAGQLDGDDRFSYAGIDVDFTRQTWHHCFQLINERHRGGLSAGPLLIEDWPDRRAALRGERHLQPHHEGRP
ncbi:GNAT family N-acetyltransferase [Lentzea sp. NPDC054927]